MADIPFVDLSRLAQRVRADVLREWENCLDRCEFVGGRHVAEFEIELAKALGVPHAVACANGTDALVLGLQALGVKPGSKVALPNLTFWATFEAVVQLGATPVLVDIDPDDLQLSLDELRKAHDATGFDAAILVHLYGWTSAQLEGIRLFCREREIPLLEDGAQAFGVIVGGAPVLAGATIATMSFYPAKVLGGAMDGGAVLTQSRERAELVRTLANHGRAGHYKHSHVGWNSRMSAMQAVYLRAMLETRVYILASRRRAAGWYRGRLFSQGEMAARLLAMKYLRSYGPPPGVQENGYLSVLATTEPDRVVRMLAQRGIRAGRVYPRTIAEQPAARSTSGVIVAGDMKHSTRFCREVINLPLFYGIRDDEQERVVAALKEALR